ncbi:MULTISPECIES: DinB family protein [Halopenitus]|uniref:Glutaredoxin n=1 Tax=Halopenitus malekzadehii TaxID=1267564 RepID=A0A1H6HYG3_9EURY|nr:MULTISPECIES: DinB family protein [Halopenitus]SEH40149.1 Glutaredoxin [Halopenitus malekzadehii]
MSTTDVHLYWATGCTSCLRAKEFLERNDVPFVSHNVVQSDESNADPADPGRIGVQGADPAMIDEMAELGLPDHVPIVRVDDDHADAKDLQAVADLVGIDHAADPLPVEELYDRLGTILEATQEYLQLIPESELDTDIPNRPRSYAELVRHVFALPDVFLMREAGTPMDSVPRMEHDWDPNSTVALATYGASVQGRFDDWFAAAADTTDWSATVSVFWGQPTRHEFFERTVWHAGQHTRQLEWILEHELGEDIDPIDSAVWEGLPMPEKVWNE